MGTRAKEGKSDFHKCKKLLRLKRFTQKSKEAILKGKVPKTDTPPRIFMHAGRDDIQPAVDDIHTLV